MARWRPRRADLQDVELLEDLGLIAYQLARLGNSVGQLVAEGNHPEAFRGVVPDPRRRRLEPGEP